jgi:hypothetical protein
MNSNNGTFSALNNGNQSDSDDFTVSDDASERSANLGVHMSNIRDVPGISTRGGKEPQTQAARYDVQSMLELLASGSWMNSRGHMMNYTLGSGEWPLLWSLALGAIGGRGNLADKSRALSPQGRGPATDIPEIGSPKKLSAFDFTPLGRENFDDALANFAVKQRPNSAAVELSSSLNRYADPTHPLAIDRLAMEGSPEPARSPPERSGRARLLDRDLLDHALRTTVSRSLDDDQDLKRTIEQINETIKVEQKIKEDAIKQMKKLGALQHEATNDEAVRQNTFPLVGSKRTMERRQKYAQPKALLKQMYDRMKATGFLKNENLVRRFLIYIVFTELRHSHNYILYIFFILAR